MSPKLMIGISVLLSGVAQVLLKQGMVRVRERILQGTFRLARLVPAVVGQVYVWLWALAFVLATALWLLGLQRVDLSFAYPLVSLSYAFVSLLAAFIFGERVGVRRWAAIGLIGLGVMLIVGT